MKITRHLDNIVWELTLRCNAKCSHCGSAAGVDRRDNLTADEIMQLFKQITAKGCAIIMSTHNTALIEQYPARTVMFAKGHISEIDLQRSFTE